MNNIFYIIACTIIFTNHAQAQTYELLNDILQKSENRKIHLKNEFESLNNDIFIARYLTERYIKDNWTPLPSNESPDSTLFFSNVNLEHIRAMARLTTDNEKIDFKKLKTHVIKVDDLEHHLKEGEIYQIISKPIFSCDYHWAIIYRYAVFKQDVGNSGILYIYRKTNNKWNLYHKITLWIS